ncbi:hypothetical protein [Alteriqipengyuania lutimaris]|uniref:Rap1a immunity protein domain-containing protein n=1 Tax=Alteriqipengyuania lutimaris TaxID=1538146 RepID=A0A395LHM0_9SPHN|nr:hypothetical protein [Alteriqipengyuania lutimaris]MBB3034719.1 hypothetical protein [Alteriqipengyuania lutimaris]RDS76426.1 hypothetical protein DL238_01585 [Alteriqipengyuania lutimaris]
MRMILRLVTAGALSLVVVPGVASAGPASVNAQQFYLDAQELLGKGVAAMFDKRTKPMMASMKDAGERARSANAAAEKRGAPLYCVSPQQRKKGMSAQDSIKLLGRVPEAERKRSTLAQAWLAALKREYPCT